MALRADEDGRSSRENGTHIRVHPCCSLPMIQPYRIADLTLRKSDGLALRKNDDFNLLFTFRKSFLGVKFHRQWNKIGGSLHAVYNIKEIPARIPNPRDSVRAASVTSFTGSYQ